MRKWANRVGELGRKCYIFTLDMAPGAGRQKDDTMKDIAIFTVTSPLHDAQAVTAQTAEFLNGLNVEHDFLGESYDAWGSHGLDVLFVRTGGTEGVFRRILPLLRERSRQPLVLLASQQSNSLAASLEILSYLKQQGLEGEVVHGTPEHVSRRLNELAAVAVARRRLATMRLGVIGEPSDWLIASAADDEAVRQRLGIELVHIGIDELVAGIGVQHAAEPLPQQLPQRLAPAWQGAVAIEMALQQIVERYALNGFTLRCFDLLSSVQNTGCLALARLNARGIVASCEGDVPAMLSMAIAQAVTGTIGFQSNPASIDVERSQILLAHCTIPLNMVQRFDYDTHIESGIGVAIRGWMQPGPVTLFKVSGDLTRHYVAQGQLITCGDQPNLCRTQALVTLDDPRDATYFLTNPIGNHHILLPGHHATALHAVLQ